MKQLFTLLSLLFLFSGCMTYIPYNNSVPPERLSDIRFKPQEQVVDLFFVEESKPERDYIRLAMLSARNTDATPAQLLNGLKEEARQLGANALLVLGSSSSDVVVNDFEFSYTVPQESISALAVRYADELEYEEGVLSHWSIVPADPTDTITRTLRFYQDGEPFKMPGERYMRLAYEHSTEFLLASVQGWEYSSFYGNTIQPVTIRRKQINSGILHSVRLFPKNRTQFDYLLLERVNGRQVNEKISLTYDEESRIVEREWKELFGKTYRVVRTYAADGKIDQEAYFLQLPGDEMKPYFTVYYHYYGPDSWELLLKETQVVKVK